VANHHVKLIVAATGRGTGAYRYPQGVETLSAPILHVVLRDKAFEHIAQSVERQLASGNCVVPPAHTWPPREPLSRASAIPQPDISQTSAVPQTYLSHTSAVPRPYLGRTSAVPQR
jgi:hypothetical protein